VANFPGTWGSGTWNQDDVIVFGDRLVGLFRVPASGGVPVQITAMDPAAPGKLPFSPSFLPDGRHFVYIRASTDEGKNAIISAQWMRNRNNRVPSHWWLPTRSQYTRPSEDPSTGYLLFVREGTLMAQPFDNRRLELKGRRRQ